MKKSISIFALCAATACGGSKAQETNTTEHPAEQTESMASPKVCEGFGPQTPRDITSKVGTNLDEFPMAPAYSELNLCNIHTHTHAEHKGPDFSIANPDKAGFQCNGTPSLTEAELVNVEGAYKHVKSGDTIEVHWVHTSCDAKPGEGLGACIPEGCENPLLRVETQVFLVVNDPAALDFTTLDYGGTSPEGKEQAKAIPADTGAPVVFRGSTTGPKYTEQVCSPAKVTWSVRPQCAKVDINSLHRWAEGNAFNETKSHGVRQLVTDPRLLSTIP